MSRPWRAVLWFFACAVVLFGAMAWLSADLVELERSERRARADAAMEEAVRLALWRMDSALAPILARQNAQPTYTYDTFYPAELNGALALTAVAGWMAPTPLLTDPGPFAKLHFRVDPDGLVRSPQVPEAPCDGQRAADYATAAQLDSWRGEFQKLSSWVDRRWLVAQLDAAGPASPARLAGTAPPLQAEGVGSVGPSPADTQVAMNVQEMAARISTANQVAMTQQVAVNYYNPPILQVSGLATPLWVHGELLLVRLVATEKGEEIQGVWMDWPGLERWLAGQVVDLLPEARLEPIEGGGVDPGGRGLAGLPTRLIPGAPPGSAAGETPSPVAMTLIVAWLAVIVAAGAVAVLLAGVISLSERRAAFVSAVTHEMRTPLTTFRMYSEMLADGMVAPRKQADYLRTLRREADRLGHLVENVLAYARLERGRRASTVEGIAVRTVLDRSLPRLRDRAEQAGMLLQLIEEPGTCELQVRADPSRVEQILLNLVDNACKYGNGGEAPTIRVAVGSLGGALKVRVSDDGPGVAPRDRRRLFRPFDKSAEEAAQTAPGVGLGLSISRQLARDMGGNLQYVPTDGPGASFELTLRTT